MAISYIGDACSYNISYESKALPLCLVISYKIGVDTSGNLGISFRGVDTSSILEISLISDKIGVDTSSTVGLLFISVKMVDTSGLLSVRKVDISTFDISHTWEKLLTFDNLLLVDTSGLSGERTIYENNND